MTDQHDTQADLIKLAAVVTAAPRWVGALLEAEGVPVPPDWLWWWRIATAILSVGMAGAEAFAINYVFNAWRNQRDKRAGRLLWLALASLAVFTLVLAPYIAANVRALKLADVLGSGWLWWSWSASVAVSTFAVVASVGYAQKRSDAEPANDARPRSQSKIELATVPASVPAVCQQCEREFSTSQALNAHRRFCVGRRGNGHGETSEILAEVNHAE